MNPKNSLKNAIIRAKYTALLRLEITFYKHALEEPVFNDFNNKHMNYLKELPPNDLLYHNSINNHFNLVCNITVQNNFISNTNFDTAPVSLSYFVDRKSKWILS